MKLSDFQNTMFIDTPSIEKPQTTKKYKDTATFIKLYFSLLDLHIFLDSN